VSRVLPRPSPRFSIRDSRFPLSPCRFSIRRFPVLCQSARFPAVSAACGPPRGRFPSSPAASNPLSAKSADRPSPVFPRESNSRPAPHRPASLRAPRGGTRSTLAAKASTRPLAETPENRVCCSANQIYIATRTFTNPPKSCTTRPSFRSAFRLPTARTNIGRTMTNSTTIESGTREWHTEPAPSGARGLACVSPAVAASPLASSTAKQCDPTLPAPPPVLSCSLHPVFSARSGRARPRNSNPESRVPTVADSCRHLADPFPIRFCPTALCLPPTAQNRLACFPKITKTRFSESFGNPRSCEADLPSSRREYQAFVSEPVLTLSFAKGNGSLLRALRVEIARLSAPRVGLAHSAAFAALCRRSAALCHPEFRLSAPSACLTGQNRPSPLPLCSNSPKAAESGKRGHDGEADFRGIRRDKPRARATWASGSWPCEVGLVGAGSSRRPASRPFPLASPFPGPWPLYPGPCPFPTPSHQLPTNCPLIAHPISPSNPPRLPQDAKSVVACFPFWRNRDFEKFWETGPRQLYGLRPSSLFPIPYSLSPAPEVTP